MTKDSSFPAYKWHPQTAEQRLFHNAKDVPSGWLDTHPANLENVIKVEQADAPAPAVFPMSREYIIKALIEGGIDFDTDAKTKVLAAKLRDAVKAALTDAEVEFDGALPTQALLELLPKPE